MPKHDITMTDDELVVTTAKRTISVPDADMREALAAFAEVLHQAGRTQAEVERQISKMVQFGLYDSEKDVIEHSDLVAALTTLAA